MSEVEKNLPKRPRSITVSEHIDVEVDPETLEEAGWVYVGSTESAPGFPMLATPTTNDSVAIVRSWHDRQHATAWPWCEQEPCKDLR